MTYPTGAVTTTTSDKFIPEIWSDETAAAYKGKTVMANLIKNVSFKGKKGDTLHIPVPARGDASAKTAATAVTLVSDTAGEVQLVINKHYEYSKLYEDIAEIQALSSMRSFYTEDAGYALAKRVDRELHKLGASLNPATAATPVLTSAGLYERAVIGGDGSTYFSGASTGNATALTDAGLRKMIQTLEDQDADVSALIIPPVEAAVLRGISRFTEQAFVGNGNAITTGRLGNLYGVEVYVSTQCPWIHLESTTTNTQVVNFSGTTLAASIATGTQNEFADTVDFTAKTDTKFRAGMLLSRDCLILGMQQAIRTQSQYKQEYLGTLVTSDTIFGTKVLREYAGLAFVVPA